MKKYIFFDFSFKQKSKKKTSRGYTCMLNTETGEITATEVIVYKSWHDFYKPVRRIKLNLKSETNSFPNTDDDFILINAKRYLTNILKLEGGEPMRSVDMPVVDYEGMEASEALMKFYVALGYNPDNQTLNPKKVKVSEADHLALTEQMKKLQPKNSDGVCLLLLNYGPSCDNDMENGKVHLYAGWVEVG